MIPAVVLAEEPVKPKATKARRFVGKGKKGGEKSTRAVAKRKHIRTKLTFHFRLAFDIVRR